MASASKSKTLYSNNNNGYPLTASFVENSTSVANNTSNITCTATLSAPNAYWSSSYNSTLTIYWHDNRQNTDIYVASITAKTIPLHGSITASGTINVTHNSDGTLSGYAYAYFTKGGSSAYTPNSGGVSTDLTALTTIPRSSVPSIVNGNNFNIGDTITINMNRKSTAFTHNVTLYFGNYSYQIATGVTDSCTLDTSTIANEMYQQIPNAAVGEGNITVTTLNGSTLVGTAQCLFYAHVVNSNPTFNAAYQDTNATTTAITQNNQLIIQNNSTLQVNITNATALNYASLSSVSVTILGQSTSEEISSATLNIDLGTINLSSNTDMVITLTDSRGITSSQTITLQMLEWSLPTAIITLARENNFYTETNINVNANYSSLDNKNTITIQYRYKKVSDSSYSQYYTLQDNVQTTFNADNTYEWNVQVLVQDRLGSTTYNLSLGKGLPIMFIDRLLNSLGINCFPADNESLEVNGENILTRIAGYGQGANQVTGDWNTACGTASGFYMGNGLSHSPSGTTVDGWWWVIHLVHNATYQRQIAFSFLNNSQIFTRIQNNGTWNDWTLAGAGNEYMTAYETSRWEQSFPSWSAQPLKLSSSRTNNSSMFTLDSTNKRVTIGKNVSTVEISGGACWWQASGTGEFDIMILKNGLAIGEGTVYNNTTLNLNNSMIPPFSVDVQEGDNIQIAVITGITKATVLNTRLHIKKLR